ncbi:Polyadenylate-binding protein-interacting protein 11 [Hibiscus syriacus]|uniref:Polyadenylate-binding protein-interacting protein 11 n=1 Tax=Hibiscus syriacus TaxID=106335 RepID=A0A6A2ZRZ7_HIBSY|nr:Polyadenylate-binding protein-interacting protein 11 [Hibiscus syriacus]
MAVVEKASNQDAAATAVASNDQDQSKQNHVRSIIDPSLHQNDHGIYNKIGGSHHRSNGGDLKRSNSVANHGLNGGFFTNNNYISRNGQANDNGAGRRKKIFNQGKRRLNNRTSMAQRDEIIRRTVYVSDIDHQVTEEHLAGLFVSYGQVVYCRICGDPNSVLRFAFIEFNDEEGARAALNLAGTILGFYPVRVLPSKTAIAPVNPTFLPRVRLIAAIYCTGTC